MIASDFVWAIVIGGLVGWLASIVMRTNAQQGAVMNIIVGIVGGFLGRILFAVVGLVPGYFLGQIVVSLVGAVLLIGILRSTRVLK